VCGVLQAARRLEADGPNKLSPPPQRPEWLKYVLQYTNPLLMLLIIAAVLTFIAYGIQTPRDSANIILAVVLFVTVALLATTQCAAARSLLRTTSDRRRFCLCCVL
jgi:P-type Ca2+ transporter type 2C